MGLNLSTNLTMFVYTFQAMWRHRPLKEYSIFVGILVACTSFSSYTLRLLIRRCFWGGFVLPVLEYCSAVWCSAADTHLKLLDRVVSGAWFLDGGVLNCNLSHRRSVAVLCMLYKIRCNPMHPCGALPVPYVPVRVSRGTFFAHRYTYAPLCCRTSQYRMTFITLSVSLWKDLVDSVFDGVGLAGFKSRSNAFLLA